jgi:hypothetical protein
MFKIEMTGLDKLNRRLRDLSKKAAALDGTHTVPMVEILTPSFLSRYTRFSSMEEMFEASGFDIKTKQDFAAIPDGKWDEFIRSVSSFPDWKAMLQEATKTWTAKQLGF